MDDVTSVDTPVRTSHGPTAGEAPTPELVLAEQLHPHAGSRFQRYLRTNPTVLLAYRSGLGALGASIIAVGVVFLVIPGPGWPIIFFGLAVLAREFHWARRLLAFTRRRVRSWTHWVAAQSPVVRVGSGVAAALLLACLAWGGLVLVGLPGWLPEPLAELLRAHVPGVS